jgi:hypothetical protein
VEGRCDGEILEAPRGSGGFGYDPVFLVPETGLSYAEMDKMLQGELDRFRIVNQFDENITADVTLSVSNATDFRNHPRSANDCGKPYLTLSSSHLTQLKAVNQDAEGLSCYIGRIIKKNGCAMPPGGAPFQLGLTRYGCFSIVLCYR